MALAVAFLVTAGCETGPEGARDTCRPHGGVVEVKGDVEGGVFHDADARVYCRDGAIFEQTGWATNQIAP